MQASRAAEFRRLRRLPESILRLIKTTSTAPTSITSTRASPMIIPVGELSGHTDRGESFLAAVSAHLLISNVISTTH